MDDLVDLLGRSRALAITNRLTWKPEGKNDPEDQGVSDQRHVLGRAALPPTPSLSASADPDLHHALRDTCKVSAALGPYLERLNVVRKAVLSESDALDAARDAQTCSDSPQTSGRGSHDSAESERSW